MIDLDGLVDQLFLNPEQVPQDVEGPVKNYLGRLNKPLWGRFLNEHLYRGIQDVTERYKIAFEYYKSIESTGIKMEPSPKPPGEFNRKVTLKELEDLEDCAAVLLYISTQYYKALLKAISEDF